ASGFATGFPRSPDHRPRRAPALCLRVNVVSADLARIFRIRTVSGRKRRYKEDAFRAMKAMGSVRVRRLAGAMVAAAIGLALNLLPFAPVTRLFPGRVATLPIAMLFGPWYGAIAAIGPALPIARTSPVVLVVFGFEALLVGSFARRGGPTLVAGALVWSAT